MQFFSSNKSAFLTNMTDDRSLSYYPIRSIMPYDRFCYVVDESVIPVSSESVDDVDNFVESIHQRRIKFRDSTGLISDSTYEELASRFNFQYTPYLIFLHEKELRNSFLNTPELVEQSTTREDFDGHQIEELLNNGDICSMISVQHVGMIDGIDVGFGVFAEQDISVGSFLGEYVGIVFATPNSSSSLQHSNDSNNGGDKLEYTCQFPSCDNGLGINAIECGNIIRFVNHSVKPNAILKSFCDKNGQMHVLCVSNNYLIIECVSQVV